MSLKLIYIDHPFLGKRSNTQATTAICQNIAKLGVIPISPIHMFSFYDDLVPKERKKALAWCDEIIPYCDALIHFGAWETSDGCQRAHLAALAEMIPIYVVSGWRGDMPLFENDNMPDWIKKLEVK